MSMIRKPKKNGFSSISRQLLQDPKLSYACKGMLAYLLSHSDEWECRVSDIERQGGIGEHARRTLMKEAEKAGYFTFTRERNEKGQFVSAYTLHEEPVPENERTQSWLVAGKDDPAVDEPAPDCPPPDDPGVDEPAVASGGGIHKKEVPNSDLHISEDTAAVTTTTRATEKTAADLQAFASKQEKAHIDTLNLDVAVREACGLSNVWDQSTERRVCNTVTALENNGFTIADVQAYRATRKKTPNLAYLLNDMLTWRNASQQPATRLAPKFTEPPNWNQMSKWEQKKYRDIWYKTAFSTV